MAVFELSLLLSRRCCCWLLCVLLCLLYLLLCCCLVLGRLSMFRAPNVRFDVRVYAITKVDFANGQ